MFNINQAREWAEKYKDIYHFTEPGKSVIDLILSLPDQWVDVEKVREVINSQLSIYTPGTVDHDIAEEITRKLKALITPKLPTLAELIEAGNDPAKYQWMQCRIGDTSRMGVITGYDEVGEFEYCTSVTFRDEVDAWFDPSLVTPLPDLPKLEWPSGVDTPIISNEEKVTADQQPNSSETPKSSPQPKVGEWWQVEEEREGKGVGKLVEDAGDYPWLIYLNDGTHDFFKRGSVAPITRMVPETHTLPKGMRLADERTLGRVMVTTEFNEDDICEIVYWNKGLGRNCPGFADESDITFLDGNQ
ncbi:hypothetical protein SEA_PSONYX_77 [Corynebacterium phage PSonyx]|nr:hypothetical protein SEA_PSONYX_77 [Corynebacterium phage PSonyx]